jgi:hypothetical protein
MGICNKRRAIKGIALVVLLAMPFLLFNPSPSFCAGKSKTVLKTKTLTVDGKTSYGIAAGERRFWVTEATTIVGAGGTKIGLSDLSIPCRATITYRQRDDGYPVALKIKLR